MSHISRYMIIVSGPTGVGKTDLVNQLALKMPCQIINADMGQMYTPLSIGTAKPDWQSASVAHHLFDCIDSPESMTVARYRELLLQKADEIWQSGDIPIIVGGSLFYIQSIFFPPQAASGSSTIPQSEAPTWDLLNSIDPDRAAEINPHDTYRIQRALDIWYATGTKPSLYKPRYSSPAHYVLMYLDRDRSELYTRIDARVHQMVKDGWLEEAKKLSGTSWHDFVVKKGILGYPELLAYLAQDSQKELESTIQDIQQKTRHYAKRQTTFWRGLRKKLHAQKHNDHVAMLEYVNLTFTDHNLYINQLLQKLRHTFGGFYECKL